MEEGPPSEEEEEGPSEEEGVEEKRVGNVVRPVWGRESLDGWDEGGEEGEDVLRRALRLSISAWTASKVAGAGGVEGG